MSESAPLLEVRGIKKQYPGVLALKGVDFDVRAGEVHCLLGPNGAGKSTLIKCVSGVVAPTEGEIRVNGEVLPVGEPSESMAHGVGTPGPGAGCCRAGGRRSPWPRGWGPSIRSAIWGRPWGSPSGFSSARSR